ncbi:MAG TPA: substrate-binding domain-containing protein [Flavobacterium sp.]|nr:substrate-binding domain-containing protein [Flavobacterium sp.]
MNNRVSLKDIAKKVGVSTALVSYVLNGLEKEKRVGEKVVIRIREAARELNYQPNQIARSLRRGSTKTIGLIVFDISNPFSGQIARVIEDEAVKNGFTVIFGSSDENKHKSEALIDTFLYRQVDGFIIAPVEGTENQIAGLVKKGIPVVLIDRYFPKINVSHVILDNFKATFDATSHLVQRGYKKITMVAWLTASTHQQDRISGYLEAMRRYNLQDEINVIEVPHSFSKMETESYIEMKLIEMTDMDALIFATNSLTLAGLYCINRLGKKVPQELGVVGFDGSEAFDFFYAPLSYVEQPLIEIGTKAASILIGLINGEKEIVHQIVNPMLNIRSSS